MNLVQITSLLIFLIYYSILYILIWCLNKFEICYLYIIIRKIHAYLMIYLLRISLQDKIEDFDPLEVDEISIGEISERPLCLQIPR